MLNYYTSIVFTYVQNVNQARNRITQYIFNTTHIHFSICLSPCPGPDHFATSAPCLPFAGVAGVWVWVASLAGRGGLAAHRSPSAVALVSETGTLARPPRPHQGRGQPRPAPTCAQVMCLGRGQINSANDLCIGTTDHSKSVSISTINSCFIVFF